MNNTPGMDIRGQDIPLGRGAGELKDRWFVGSGAACTRVQTETKRYGENGVHGRQTAVVQEWELGSQLTMMLYNIQENIRSFI